MVDNPSARIASQSWALLRAGGLKRCGSKGSFSELRAGGSGALQKAHSKLFDDSL